MSSKVGRCWLPMTIFFREKENDGHRQSSNNVFDDCPWPSFHKCGMPSHHHHFLNFQKITPFFGQNFGFLDLYRVWYTCWNTYESSESKFITKKSKIITNNPGDSIQCYALFIPSPGGPPDMIHMSWLSHRRKLFFFSLETPFSDLRTRFPRVPRFTLVKTQSWRFPNFW